MKNLLMVSEELKETLLDRYKSYRPSTDIC